MRRAKAIKSALHTARRYGKKYADGGKASTGNTSMESLLYDQETDQLKDQIRNREYPPDAYMASKGLQPSRGLGDRMVEHPDYYQWYSPQNDHVKYPGNPPWTAGSFADGGDVQYTEPTADDPNRYPYFQAKPDGAGVESPGVPADDPAALAYSKLPAPTKPTRMEPDLTETQLGQPDRPTGIDPNYLEMSDSGEWVDSRTKQVIPEEQVTRRPNVLPITQTPEGQPELAMPKMWDIIGNMGGGWGAPVSGAETILGAGMRIPRRGGRPDIHPDIGVSATEKAQDLADELVRVHGDDHSAIRDKLNTLLPEAQDMVFDRLPEHIRHGIKTEDAYAGKKINLDEFFQQVSPSDVEHLSHDELRQIDNQLRQSGSRWADYSNKNPDLWEALHTRMKEELGDSPKPKADGREEFEEAYNQPQHNFSNLDELEAAARRQSAGSNQFEQAPLFKEPRSAIEYLRERTGRDPKELYGYINPEDYVVAANRLAGNLARYGNTSRAAHPNAPINSGETISVPDFFANHTAADVPRLTDQQLFDLDQQLSLHQVADTGTWSNLNNRQPELIDAIYSATADRRAAKNAPDPESAAILDGLVERLGRSGLSVEPQSGRMPTPPPSPGPFETLSRDFVNYFNRALAPHVKTVDEFAKKYFGGMDTKRISGGAYHDGQYNTPAIELSGILLTPEGKNIGSITRTIFPEKKLAYHNLFSVNEDFQSTGIPAQILRNQIDLYRQIGINQVRLTAGLESGPYAWLKYGFIPDKGKWETIRHDLTNSIMNDDIHITNPETRDAVLRILENSNPRSAWDLADFKGTDKYGNEIGPLAMLGHDMKGVKGEVRVRKQGWGGALLLNDAAVMARFNRYANRPPKKK